jgi:hypothetical protein
MDMTAEHGRGPRIRPQAIVIGVVVMAIGAAMLFDTTGLMRINAGSLIAPFVLIALGTAMLLGPRNRGRSAADATDDRICHGRRNGRFGGIWMIGLGCWLLISQTGMFGLTFGTSWPLLLILMGGLMAMRGWR